MHKRHREKERAKERGENAINANVLGYHPICTKIHPIKNYIHLSPYNPIFIKGLTHQMIKLQHLM